MKIVVSGREIEVDDQVITKALEDKTDVTVDAPNLVIRERSEEEAFVRNIKEDAKVAGVEIAIKDVRNSLGLDFQGKTMDNLVEAVKAKAIADANIEPDKKVKMLETDIETLKGTIQSVTKEKEQVMNQFNSFKSEHVLNTTLSAIIPDNVVLPKDDMLVILKNKMRFQVDEQNRINVLDADGQIKKNPATLDPLDVKSVITSFFNENTAYLKPVGGGAGGADIPGGNGGTMTVEQFIEKKAKEGVSHTSEAFNQELNELIKAGQIKM